MSDQELTRELGGLEATSIGLGTMIGGGIFILPSLAAEQAGPASMISFALAGGITLLAALAHAELATAIPADGGSYAYVHRALGPLGGSIVGWGLWFGTVFTSAFYALGFGRYLTFFSDAVPVVVAALAVIVLLVGLNYYGAAEAGWLQDVLVIALVALILAFVGFGIPAVDGERLRPFAPNGWTAVFSTVGTLYVTFIGFGTIATVAGEIENPAKNVPISMITTVLVPTVLYVFVMFVSIGVLSIDELAGSHIPLTSVAQQFLGPLGALTMVFGALIATVSSANAAILQASRMSFAMGERSTLDAWITVTHERFGTPHRSVLITGAGILGLVGARVGISTLAEVAGVLYLVSFALVHVALVKLRRDDADYDPSFRIPDVVYPWVPVVGFAAILGILLQMRPFVLAIGAGLLFASGLWYVVIVSGE